MRRFGDLIQTIEGLRGHGSLRGPPYAYYGGSAFEPARLPPVGAMWLPGYRLAAKVPGERGTVFYANGPFRWGNTDGGDYSYPDYGQQILATEPTGWDIRTGMHPRGYYFPGSVGPSVSGLLGLSQQLTPEAIDFLRTQWALCEEEGAPNKLQCTYQKLIAAGYSEEEAREAMGLMISGAIERSAPRPDLVEAREKGLIPEKAPTWIPWAIGGVAAAGLVAYFAMRK